MPIYFMALRPRNAMVPLIKCKLKLLVNWIICFCHAVYLQSPETQKCCKWDWCGLVLVAWQKKLIDFLPLIWLNWCALHICSMVWFHMVLTLILYSVEQSDCYITHWPIQNRNYCIVCTRVNEQTKWHKQETLHSIDRQNELPQIN